MIRLFGLSFFKSLLFIAIIPGGFSVRFRSAEAEKVSLYSRSDNVHVVEGLVFQKALKAPALGKLVQYLNIFCGHCRRFVPIYKKLAIDLQKWNRILRIFAVDCAQEDNVSVCRDFEIKSTPTLRYYHSNFVKSRHGLGTNLPIESSKKIVDLLVKHLAKNDYTGTKELKPIFAPVQKNETAKSIFGRFNSKLLYILLVFQPQNSQIGILTLLDLLPYPDVAVRILNDAQLFTQFGLKPSARNIALLDRTGKEHPLRPTEESSSAYVESVAKFLEQNKHTRIPKLPTTIAPKEVLPQGMDAIILKKVLASPPVVYQADLEQALHQLLHIEIPKAPLIKGEKFLALYRLIQLFNRFNPLNQDGRKLLFRLESHLKTIKKIKGAELANKVTEIEKSLGKVFKIFRYVGCIGSKPLMRGITCSFWTLFHHLTVMSAQNPKVFKPGFVIFALFGFAKYFFGCTECAKHFQQMAKRRNVESVRSHDEEILWLWAAHNEVNNRLAGDATEDPKFPKVQFPLRKHCPACHKKPNGWNTAEVLKYLKRIYSIKRVSFYGLPTLRRT
ncbi:sulfhydryl oxidase 1-like [Drosophila gunungcola]|uniref:sulfhydryl oxidase 1-like n=1 Tax=Drosophila gunungcola TaxID=103775 RepID=UPI0022E0AF90|nr:sulfhydryl oxidase 1-like [Drosophila gunungcola]